jgi:hypothetical protein
MGAGGDGAAGRSNRTYVPDRSCQFGQRRPAKRKVHVSGACARGTIGSRV